MSTLFISLRFCPQEHGSDCPPWHGLELRRPRLKGTNWPTNWWMSFWAFWARLLGGKTRGFWQVFFGPKPIGSNQKRGSDLGKKGMECLEFWSLKLMSLKFRSWFPVVFLLLGCPNEKASFHGVWQGNYQGFAERGCWRQGGGSFCLMSSSTLIGLW